MSRDHTTNFWMLLGGTAVGIAAAVLLSPSSGKEARRLLLMGAEKGRGLLGDSGRDLFQVGRELYEQGRAIAEEAAELFEQGREVADRKIDEVR